MASLTEEIGNLVAATNALLERVEELLAAVDGDVDSKIDAALAELNLLTTVTNIIDQKIASGQIGTNAQTLGGHPVSDFVLKTDNVDLGGV